MKDLTLKKLTNYFSKYPLKKYKKGEIILRPGEKPNYVGFIKSGFIRVYTLNESEQEITMSLFKPMLYFTTIFVMTEEVNKFYFESVSPVEMWMAPKNEFVDYCKKNGDICKDIMETIGKLFLNLVENTGKLLGTNSLGKVAMIITSIADSKSHFALTHKMVASLTGLTRETVTLQMLKLEKMKLVDNSNRKVTILNRDGLDKLIGK